MNASDPSSEPEYISHLNPAQKEAVLAIDGPVSVLAGAGSGKTSVLTTRIYHLIRKGVPAHKILAVTFTNKAAREMRERLHVKLPDSPLPFVATFHGLGRELLQTYGTVMDIPRYFTIYDRDDSKSAIREALKALDVDPKEVPPSAILGRISKAKGEGQTLQEFRDKHGRESFRSRIVAEAWIRYEETLKREKSLDFDDLIVLPVRLLQNHEEVRLKVQERFSHIHVDEFQDTNELQGRLANLIAGKPQNLFVVGDIDQSIYTWRGATIDNLLKFEDTYASAKHIVLEHNYRSTKTIVDAANGVIEKNQNRKDKHAVTDNPEGEPITIHPSSTAESEARWIAQQAGRILRKGVVPEEIAVLFRTNFQSRALEEAFLHAGIPYRLLGTRFFDRKEVKDVLAWIRVALEPDREVDRMRAVQSPPRGIGKVTLGKLLAGKQSELRAADRTKVDAFEALLTSLREAAQTLVPSEFVKLVIERSGIQSALIKEGEDGQERLENAKELGTLASRHDGTPGLDGICTFLAEAALAGDQDEMDREEGKTGVTLMTVHAAKGLEFDTVFVTGLEEGLFPHEGMGNEERDEEEERRLFYVAVTRAKKKLILTLARMRRIYGTDYMSEPSSFLRDISPLLIHYDEADEYGAENIIEA
ncbi:MAG: ATP-dependent helicase PcrA, helicase / ATP-dependent helicase PcrA [Parcubacteria group bacterium]|nr:ATP-dependent helicase PcrA, helicase / ATP-dependent helicase PcrA [Parcubacteria group bacterium]